jgi:Protein of unknown function (DUF2478)
MKLAYFTMPDRGMTDALIAQAVEEFEINGLRLAGTVRARPVDPHAHPCDMELRVLPDGPVTRISQTLGSGSKGCRLDGGAIESIAAAVEMRLIAADLLIINKFGKQEARSRGLCPAIAMAQEMGIPTLVGVNQMNRPDFMAFSAGMAEPLPPDLRAIHAWFDRVIALSEKPAPLNAA